MKISILGNGSWSSALVKILCDNGQHVNWWMRDEKAIAHLEQRHHNLHYLSSVVFPVEKIKFYTDVEKCIDESDVILVGIPSAFLVSIFEKISSDVLKNKKIISAVKGILPNKNCLFNQYLVAEKNVLEENYFCITGPCHAEEVAAEKLSYLTFAGKDENVLQEIACCFQTAYLKTITTNDVNGVQYASVLKNIYALGAGIAHGLDYGDNFLSVYITNCFAEMQQFMEKFATTQQHHYNTSAYLGDLLVTCYSLFSRNRSFGNYIGKGYSIAATKAELNMVAEGYFASKGIFEICEKENVHLPIAKSIFEILWKEKNPKQLFKQLEKGLK